MVAVVHAAVYDSDEQSRWEKDWVNALGELRGAANGIDMGAAAERLDSIRGRLGQGDVLVAWKGKMTTVTPLEDQGLGRIVFTIIEMECDYPGAPPHVAYLYKQDPDGTYEKSLRGKYPSPGGWDVKFSAEIDRSELASGLPDRLQSTTIGSVLGGIAKSVGWAISAFGGNQISAQQAEYYKSARPIVFVGRLASLEIDTDIADAIVELEREKLRLERARQEKEKLEQAKREEELKRDQKAAEPLYRLLEEDRIELAEALSPDVQKIEKVVCSVRCESKQGLFSHELVDWPTDKPAPDCSRLVHVLEQLDIGCSSEGELLNCQLLDNTRSVQDRIESALYSRNSKAGDLQNLHDDAIALQQRLSALNEEDLSELYWCVANFYAVDTRINPPYDLKWGASLEEVRQVASRVGLKFPGSWDGFKAEDYDLPPRRGWKTRWARGSFGGLDNMYIIFIFNSDEKLVMVRVQGNFPGVLPSANTRKAIQEAREATTKIFTPHWQRYYNAIEAKYGEPDKGPTTKPSPGGSWTIWSDQLGNVIALRLDGTSFFNQYEFGVDYRSTATRRVPEGVSEF